VISITIIERKQLIDDLIYNYLSEKANNKVHQRERSQGLSMALGKLIGVCMAFKLDIEETKESVTILTREKKKIVTKIII